MVELNTLRLKRQQVLALAQKYGAKNVRIFGSVARGETHPQSDLDMLVDFETGRSLFDRIGLTQDLEELLGCRADVVSEKALHWFIRDRILKEAIPL